MANECDCCGEPYCEECGAHYDDCDCDGGVQDAEFDYRIGGDGTALAPRHDGAE